MLRPKRMSKVSVTGSRNVLEPVVETVHDLDLVHLIDYDGRWDGFENGDPVSGADEASEKLVTVRSLESILAVTADDAGPSRIVDDEELESELERVRTRVNELDDRRDELRNELRRVDERLTAARPFAAIGIDLDLLSGYDSLEVAVGEGNVDQLDEALSASDSIAAHEMFSGDGAVAVFAYPEADSENVIDDALVGIEFTALDVPDEDGSPEEYVADLHHRKQRLESEIGTVEGELEGVKLDAAGFLLAAEEELSIEVQKAEAPLQFATTERSFIAEGWIPTERYGELERALADAVGDHVDIEELERASYDSHGHPHDREHVSGGAAGGAAAADGSGDGYMQAEEDHDHHGDEPPVVQDNPQAAQPFEVLTNALNRPSYNELDPTLIVFLTFPFAFGFMIGDIGYGLLYIAMGVFMFRFDSEVIKALGWISVWAGIFTMIFGYLYDDFFGVHMSDVGLFLPLAGTLDKGLQTTEWAMFWIAACILFGLLHLNIGFLMGFINDRSHGVVEAALHNISWIFVVNGFFMWVFSAHLLEPKPDFLVGPESVFAAGSEFNELTGLAFEALPETVGLIGLGISAVGVVGAIKGEGPAIGLLETITYSLGHTLSYLRMVAVLLAKAGMAFVVNLLVFGGYVHPDTGYTLFGVPGAGVTGYEAEFVGLIHMDPLIITIPVAIAVFIVGHIVVLLLGITAAGIQMARLEYVEFFGKFYEGGGENYEPFGYRRTYTEDR